MLLASANGADVHHCDWRTLLGVVAAAGGCDLLATDCPYSEKTRAGHDDGVTGAEDVLAFARGDKGRERERRYAIRKAIEGKPRRRGIDYSFWTPADVLAFVEAWHPLTRGWFVTITDDVLAPAWQEAFKAVGRYVFAPLPYVAPGSRVRLTGDGPSAWTCWIVVARPRSREFASWGTLPGAYVLPPGEGGAMPVVGGKPLWLMQELVKDYSRPNDLIVDPCCGSGTLAAAAIRTGRRAIVGDLNLEHAEIAARWIRDPAPKCPDEQQGKQRVLW